MIKSSDFPNKIKAILKALGLTQSGLAAKMGVSQGIISEFSSGTRDPSKEFLFGISKLGISLDWFLTGEGEIFLKNTPQQPEKDPLIREIEVIFSRNIKEFEDRLARVEAKIGKNSDSNMFVSEPEPEYGEESEEIAFVDNIAAGWPIYQSDYTSFIPVPKRFIKTKPEDYYVGRISGTSMTAAGIPDGVLVLIRKSDTPRDGAIQVVECQGEATLKRMREIPGKGWKICFDDHTGRYIEIGPGEEFIIQGDFIAVLPEDK